MRRSVLSILLVLVACASMAQHTGRGKLRVSPKAAAGASEVVYDTIVVEKSDSVVRLTGYEKPREASRETVFAQNLTDRNLEALDIEISYLTIDGKELHRRTVSLAAQIPAGERRMLTFKSWDVNRMFYYHVNVPNTSRQATPYRVELRVVRLYLLPEGKGALLPEGRNDLLPEENGASKGCTTDSITS